MATLSPTISIQATPGLQVSGAGGITYFQMLQELGYSVYWVKDFYYWASSLTQFSNPLQYLIFDISGNQRQAVTLALVSPDQFANVVIVKAEKKELPIILNGASRVMLNINPGISLQFLFYNKRIRMQDPLNAFEPDNFKKLESVMDMPDFFNDYTEQL